jgi:hypothetical protein
MTVMIALDFSRMTFCVRFSFQHRSCRKEAETACGCALDELAARDVAS